MASKIKSRTFYVTIAPYKVDGIEDEFNELSVMADYNEYTHVFYVSLHAGWKTGWGGHGCIILGNRDPLTSNIMVPVKESPRNSKKTIDEMAAALEIATNDIVWLFNERMWPELRQFVKDVSLYGYNAMLENRIQDYKRAKQFGYNNSTNNSKNETMANEMKAADLIGKNIVVGENTATIVIKSADGDKLTAEFKRGDTPAVAMPLTLSQVEKMLADGVWKIADGAQAAPKATASEDVEEVEDIKPEAPKAKTVKMDEPKAEEAKTKTEKPKVTLKTKQPQGKDKPKAKTEKPKAETARFTYETYTNKKGKTCAKITGFTEAHAAYKKENATVLHGSPMDGCLLFGKAYVAFAKQLCDALNEGKTLDDCKAMLAKYDEKRASDKAQAKAEREEHKAEKSEGKVYTNADVAEMLKKIMAGGDIPENIKKAMAA